MQQIHSAIEQIRTVTGGRLAGIRVQLAVRPEKAAYTDKDGTKKSTVVYALNLELSAQGMQKLVDQMTENTKLFESTKKLLGDGRRYVIEDEADEVRAIEVAREFHSVGRDCSGSAGNPATEPDIGSALLRNRILQLRNCTRTSGYLAAKTARRKVATASSTRARRRLRSCERWSSSVGIRTSKQNGC